MDELRRRQFFTKNRFPAGKILALARLAARAQKGDQFKYSEDNQTEPKIDQRPHINPKSLMACSGRKIGRESEIQSVPEENNDQPSD